MFPNKAKRAIVTPLDKSGKDKASISNYRPVSVLSVFSKIYERVMKNQMVSFLEYKLSSYLSAYRKSYSTQHVLIRLIEEWKDYLDKNYYVGAVLLDLSKAFDCVPHDLIIAKMHAYGFNMDALKLILSYLTNRKQATCINSIYSMFQEIISGVPQGSILGPIIFNIFINDLLLFIVNCNVHNYADDNTISSFSNSINDLVKKLEKETNLALCWLTNNFMIANPGKFHAIFLSRSKENIINIEVKIGDKIIKSEQEVELLGVKIDNHLKFESHVKKLCKSASAQLNSLYRFKYILPYEVKYILIQSFIFANFNYCPLIWNFSSSKSLLKIDHIQKRALRLLYDDDISSYEELLEKSNRSSMNIYRLRTLCTEIYKTLNSLNPLYMKEIFQFQEKKGLLDNRT